jgi:hypothetical protein
VKLCVGDISRIGLKSAHQAEFIQHHTEFAA